jgi:hypothetical protein
MRRALTWVLLLSCSGPAVNSDEQAQRAYLGLDRSIGKCLTLGFQGFNLASSANIDPQSTTGDKSGTLVITGKADQGSSTNKGFKLNIGMTNYSDGDVRVDGGPVVAITYATGADAGLAAEPVLDIQLKNFPNGTLDGPLSGEFAMSGDLGGTVKLDLMLNGMTESNGDGGTQRKPGTTSVTGTATSGNGTFNVNLTL